MTEKVTYMQQGFFFRRSNGNLTNPIIVNGFHRYTFVNGSGFCFSVPRAEQRNGTPRHSVDLESDHMTSCVRSTHVHWTHIQSLIRVKIQVLEFSTLNTRPTHMRRAHTRRRVAAP